MFSALLAAACIAILPVLADPTPSEPAPGDVFNQGQNCNIVWAADDTAVWKVMNIELMTGDNFNMVHLSTVATVDGTDPTKTSFSYPCLSVTPNSAIYFYQFSSPAAPNKTWTGRFAIADENGNTTPPPNQIQPGGAAIPWGTGRLVDPSKGTPAPDAGNSTTPATGGSTSASGTSSSSSSSSSAVQSLPSTTPSSLSRSLATGSSSSRSSASSSSSPSPSAATSQGSGATPMRTYSAAAAFLAAAAVFVMVL